MSLDQLHVFSLRKQITTRNSQLVGLVCVNFNTHKPALTWTNASVTSASEASE